MRFRYRFLACVFAIAAFFSLISCKRSAPDVQMPQATATEIAPSSEPTPEPTSEPTPAPTPTPTPTITQASEWSRDAFIQGESDTRGYRSDFLRFGFHVPEGWSVCTPMAFDAFNGTNSEATDPETTRKELVMRLKRGDAVIDFESFNMKPYGYIYVIIVDFTPYDQPVDTELKALETVEALVLLGDDVRSNENIEYVLIDIGERKHPVCLYDSIDEGKLRKGMIFAIERGPLYALVQMVVEDETVFNCVLDSFYLMD